MCSHVITGYTPAQLIHLVMPEKTPERLEQFCFGFSALHLSSDRVATLVSRIGHRELGSTTTSEH